MLLSEADVLRLRLHAMERELANNQAQQQIARAQAAHEAARTVLAQHGIDPETAAVVLEAGNTHPIGTVLHTATGLPLGADGKPVPPPDSVPVNRATRRKSGRTKRTR